MGKIILTAEMRTTFGTAQGKQEVRDEKGALLGFYQPLPTKFEAIGPFTAEEVERAFKQTGPGRTLDEILKDAGLS